MKSDKKARVAVDRKQKPLGAIERHKAKIRISAYRSARREPFSHFNVHGSPKVSHLTEEAAETHAAKIGGFVYRCTEKGCLHVGRRN